MFRGRRVFSIAREPAREPARGLESENLLFEYHDKCCVTNFAVEVPGAGKPA